MNQENERKQPAVETGKQQEAHPTSQAGERLNTNEQRSDRGNIDQEEGRMHNGELGAGLKKEE